MSTLNNLSYLWKNTSKQTKLKVLQSLVFPVATYGCESWTMNIIDKTRIEAFEGKCYRKILRIPYTEHRSNISIRRELNVEDNWLNNCIMRNKLKYFGHIKRHDGLERTIMEARIAGKRGRGRPRKRWESNIKEELGMNISEAGRLAQDRSVYRRAVKAATSGIG